MRCPTSPGGKPAPLVIEFHAAGVSNLTVPLRRPERRHETAGKEEI
jgi:hypothetical protein